MNNKNYFQGFSLIELMITIAIIGILSAIAIPAYNGYIKTSILSTAKQNAVTLAGFEDAYFYEHETYLAGIYVPGGANGLAALEWSPPTDDNYYIYTVSAGQCGNINKCYTMVVKHISDPNNLQQVLNRP